MRRPRRQVRPAPAACALWAMLGTVGVAVAQGSGPAPASNPPSTSAPAPRVAPAPAAAAAAASNASTAPDGSQRIVIEGRADDADSQRRNAAVGTTVVGRDELDAYGDNSILDVLQRVPGISIDGETPRLRGLGSGYTQILLNGEPAPPGFSLDSLAPSEIERIEIVKGPTAEFGGVAGTINVILRGAPKFQQREFRASAGFRAVKPQGSTSFSWGDRIGPVGFHLPITAYAWANGADLQVTRRSRSRAGVVSEQQVTGRDEWTGGGVNIAPRLDWKISDTDNLQWQAFGQRNENRNSGRRDTVALQGPAPGSIHDESASSSNWQLARTQLQWVRKTPEGARFELKGMGQGSASRGAGESQGLSPVSGPGVQRTSEFENRERTATLGGRWRQPWGESHTLNMGLDHDERRRTEWRRQFENGVEKPTPTVGPVFPSSTRRRTAFIQDEWTPAEGWSLMGGLRAEEARLTTGGPLGEVTGQYRALSPVAHIRHNLDPKGRDVIRASVARSIRVPDIGLLLPRYNLNGSYDRDTPNTPIAADSAGNPQLQPERSTGFDFAWEQYLPGGGVLSMGGFHRRIEGLIRRRIALENVAEANVPRWVSRPSNLGQARSTGLELELKGQADALLGRYWAQAPKTLQLRAALSIYRSSVEQIDDPDARLDGQAPWAATFGFDHSVMNRFISYGSTLAVSPGFSTQQTDRQRVWRSGSQRLDAYVVVRFDRQTSLRAAITNALHPDIRSSSRVEDLDGFAAGSESVRQNPSQFTLSFQSRF